MPEIPQRKLTELVGLMFDAAQKASPDAWDDVYLAIAQTFSSGPGGFIFYNKQTDEFKVMAGTRDDRVALNYLERFQHTSPFRKYVTDLEPGERFNREEYMSDDDFRQADIYRDSFAPAAIFHIEYRVFRAYREIRRGLLLTRPEGQKNFDSSESAALTFLISYLEKAFRVYVSLIESKRQSRLMTDAFDCFSHSVLVVDRNESLIFANKSGNEILAQENGLRTDRYGKIRTTSAADARKFRTVLDKVFDGNYEQGKSEGVLKVTREKGLRPLEILVSRCEEHDAGDNYNEPLAIIYISDPDQQIETVDSVLTRIYGLTDAEARIAGLLTNGLSLGQICDELGIKQNTVRTHLKHIFSKTETNRQAELIKLILNSPANLNMHRE
ncbi:MAG: helix-turn-helix transcriptional regulator [Acidobacteria bacterium]|nr:helix-turn-helix transcriptional regulator [Acidobacteriota bacterium]